nr:immunoglobulin heavy chain junction region [Macaca mulatta]
CASDQSPHGLDSW